jgi:23S rRNA pseudoU1915 N3-methylase RlmH
VQSVAKRYFITIQRNPKPYYLYAMNPFAKQEILQLIARDEIENAIELLMAQMPKAGSIDMVLQSNRFYSLQKDIRMGIVAYADKTITKNQIVFGILEMIKSMEGDRSRTVLVAGTGRESLPPEVWMTARSLGRKLGEQNCSLVVGGWQGVDYVVAEAYAGAVAASGRSLSEQMVQVVPEGTEPIYRGGNVVPVKRGVREWIEAIKYADVVVLIGGEGGTYETFAYAHQEARPVLPVAAAGGDSRRVWDEIRSRWGYWQGNLLAGVDASAFEALNQPVATETDADRVADQVMACIMALEE